MTDVVPYTGREVGFTADWLLDPAEIAQRIGGTDFVPKALRNNPAAITAALLYGLEVGLGRMQSLAKIAVIDGRPSLAAEAQRALILAAGHEIWPEEATITRCVMAGPLGWRNTAPPAGGAANAWQVQKNRRHATGVSRDRNTSLPLTTVTASACHG